MILLTGGSGFFGSHLLARSASSFSYRCLMRPSAAVRNRFPVEIVEADVADRSSLQGILSGVDTVLHMAALIRGASPKEIIRVNLEGTRALVEEAKTHNVRRFVFVSTENALREDLKDAYAASKREAEAVVRTFPNSLILRPCFVYGPGDDHGLGRLIQLAVRSPLVPVFGGLKSFIQPIYVDDMVEYLVRSLKNDLTGSYLIVGPDAIHLNDFLKKYCETMGLKRRFVALPKSVLGLSAKAADLLPSAVGWGTNQFRNIYGSRTYSIEKTVQDFQFTPRSVEQGLQAFLRQT